MMETGANDVLVVRPVTGSIDQQERLIPWIPEQVVTLLMLSTNV
jgi:16S rRNA processing protein RimM